MIISDMINIAVDHNGLIVPGHSVERFFSKYCVPLGYWTGLEDWPLSFPGSATLIKYRERYFMACTRHQLADINATEDVCITLPDGFGKTRSITSGGVITFDADRNDGDHNDIALFDFTEPVMDHPVLEPMFFDFRGQHPDIPADKIVGAITWGYPIEGRNIDYESGKIDLVKRGAICQYTGEGADDAVHVMRFVDSLMFDPDGVSGGPTFTIVMQNGKFSIHFAGMNVRANKEIIRVVKAGAIQIMMNNFINLRPRSGMGI